MMDIDKNNQHQERLRRLQAEGDDALPTRRTLEVEELLVRFPRLPGDPPALYGGLIRVSTFDDHDLVESRLSPVEAEAGLVLVEVPEVMTRALHRHGERLREALG